MRRLSLVFAFILLFSASASAMPGMGPGGKGEKAVSPEEKFKSMDKNGDGSVSREEFFEFYPHMHESAFKNIDKDGSLHLTLEEWINFSSQHNRDMGASGMGGGSRGPVMREMFREGGTGEAPAGEPAQAPTPAPTDGKGRTLFEFKPKNEAAQ